jgi:serine/threonine protein kinase
MDELKNKILLQKFKIIKRIGKGAFGCVYLGKDLSKEEYVAIKLEIRDQNDIILERETYILYMLKGLGIPQVIAYGHNLKYNILIQELLGKSLDNILFDKKYKFSLKDSCMAGIQILDRLEYIHNKGIIHRDIKADNFLIGIKKKEIIYIIDFGLAKQYLNNKTGKHVKYCVNKKWSGTSRFASANTLKGIEPSRRDDMESFCYLLLYLMKGSLPWDQINEPSEINEILIIYKMKEYMPADIMFKDLPWQMSEFYKYCKNLNFEQKPNYNYLRKLLINILEYIGEKNDLYFSWIINISPPINKSKTGIINRIRKINFNYNSCNNSPKNEKEKQIILNKNTLPKKYIHVKNINSFEEINKGNIDEKNKELKNHILGHSYIIKRNYIKSQSPNTKRTLIKNEKEKKEKKENKIDINKNKVVIDLTDFIENKKANEIKSYKAKLFNYRINKNKKLIKSKIINMNSWSEGKISKKFNNTSFNNIYKIKFPIKKVGTYSIIDFSGIKFKNAHKNRIDDIHLDKKAISPKISKKVIKLNINKFIKNKNNSFIKTKNTQSFSFIKEFQSTNNHKNKNPKNDKLNIIFPKRKMTSFMKSCYINQNPLMNSTNNIYNKKILKINSENKSNSNLIKHKNTDNRFLYNRTMKNDIKKIIFENDKIKKKRNLFINLNINNSININGLYVNNGYKTQTKNENSNILFKGKI